VRFDASVEPALRLVLADAQTNGGLLAAVEGERTGEIVQTLRAAGLEVVEIGDVVEAEPGIDVSSG
jgi:selenide,water dikinase